MLGVYQFRHEALLASRIAPVWCRNARHVREPFAAAVVLRLTVAIRTQELKILGSVVQPVAVLVIDVEDQPTAEPLVTQGTPLALAMVLSPHLQQRSSQPICTLPLPGQAKSERLLPSSFRRPLCDGPWFAA